MPDRLHANAHLVKRESLLTATLRPGTASAPTEQTQVKALRLALHQVGQDFRHHGGKLEAMSGTRAGNPDARLSRMAVDPEVLVGRVRVRADDGHAQRAVCGRDETSQNGAHCVDLLLCHLAPK